MESADLCDVQSAFRISDIQSIAAMLYPDDSGEQKFWVSQARNVFTAFALYVFERYEDGKSKGRPSARLAYPTLGQIYRLSSGDGNSLRSYIQQLAEQDFLSEHGRTAFANLLSQAEDTFSSIMGMFKEPLNAWINPVLDAATSGNDFMLTDVRKKKMSIYIGIQPNKLAESRLIINLFFSQLINENTRELPQNNPTLKHQCLLLMDEFTSIGKIEILATAVSYMAGYNMRLLPIIQSMAQLDATYGKDLSRTIITNHAMQIIFAPREQQDANDYSEMLGYTTVSRDSVTRGREYSRSRSDERRALMLPQELKAMGTDKEVILYEGIAQPVQCEKIFYFKEKHFTRRLLEKVVVPELSLEETPVKIAKAAALAAAGLAMMAPAHGASRPGAVVEEKSPSIEVTQQDRTWPSVDRVARAMLDLAAGLSDRSGITLDALELATGIQLIRREEFAGFSSGDLGGGWHYFIDYAEESSVMRRGFALEFSTVLGAKATSPMPCPISLDDARQRLRHAGYEEDEAIGSHGDRFAWRYTKSDIHISIIPQPSGINGEMVDCIRKIQTIN